MKTLLLAGYQNNEKINSGLIHFKDKLWIDWQIAQLQIMKHEVTVVLGDKFSEDLLQKSTMIKKCDLVFDTNGDQTTLMSNLRSGLFSVIQICNVLPIHTPVPNKTTWHKLNDHYYRVNAEKFDLIKSFCPIDGKMLEGFPVLITRSGIKKIKQNKHLVSLNDSAILFSPVPYLAKDIARVFPGCEI